MIGDGVVAAGGIAVVVPGVVTGVVDGRWW